MSRNRIRFALLFASESWLFLISLCIWRWTVDDSFIGYRYARNLATGWGLVFNRGERVEGYTNFLWVVLLAAASKVAPDPVAASKVFGTLFNFLVIAVCYYLCRIIATEQAPMHGIALAVTATCGLFVATSVEGLETPLFTMLLCLLTACYLRSLQLAGERQLGWLAGSSLLSGLVLLTRPDGAITYGLLWLYAAWRFRNHKRNLVAFSLPMVSMYVPYFLWRWHYYGFLFPNTFYAKGGGTLALYSLGAAHIGSFLNSECGGLLVVGLVGLWAIFYPCTETTVLGLTVASRLLFELWSGGVTAGNSRFLVPTLPLIWLLIERTVAGWLQACRLGAKGAYLMVAISTLLISAQLVRFTRFHRKVMEPEQAGLERAHVSAGKWLEANAQPDATVAVGDIGAIGFWSGLGIIDVDGLTDTVIAHSPGAFGSKGDADYVLSRHPDFIILRMRHCEPRLDDVILNIDRKIFADPRFQKSFVPLSCRAFFPDFNLLLYKRNSNQPRVRNGS